MSGVDGMNDRYHGDVKAALSVCMGCMGACLGLHGCDKNHYARDTRAQEQDQREVAKEWSCMIYAQGE